MANLIALTACQASSPIPPIVPEPITDADVISAENASTLVEFSEFSEGNMGPITALAFTPDNAQIRVVHAHNTPRLRHWSIADHMIMAEIDLEAVGLGAVAFDGTARMIAMAGVASEMAFSDSYLTGITPDQVNGPTDGIHWVDAENGQLLRFLSPSSDTPKDFNGVELSQDGHIVASGRTDPTGAMEPEIIVMEVPPDPSLPATVLLSVPHAQAPYVTDFALDVEGRLFATYVSNGLFQLWDLTSQEEWGTLELPTDQADKKPDDQVHQIAISPTRQWLAAFSLALTNDSTSGGNREQVILWRLEDRQVQSQAEIESPFLSAFAFNPSGTLLAAGTDDGVHIWNVVTGEEVKVFPGEPVLALAFSPDGAQLAWGDYSGILHLAGLPEE